MSSPRSGTTWLKQALNNHPDVFCTEGRLFGDYFDTVYDDNSSDTRIRITLDKYVDSFLLHYDWRQICGHDGRDSFRNKLIAGFIRSINWTAIQESGKSVIIDKITPYRDTAANVLASIDRYFPKAKVIHLVRDGRDVATSGVFHWLTKSTGFETASALDINRKQFIIGDPSARTPDRFFNDTELVEWATTWVQPIEALLDSGRDVLLIRYEEMIADITNVIKRICTHLELRTSRKVLDACASNSTFELMSGGRKRGEENPTAHVRKGVVGDWKNYFTKQDGVLINEKIGKKLVEFGYEKNDAWIKSLPDKLV